MRADIERVGGDVEQMVEDAGDLGEQRADPLRRAAAPRCPAASRSPSAKACSCAHRRDVIEPVEIRHRLHVGLVLDQLLGAAMQQADMRVGALDHLAVHLQDQAQHAVRGRMLRAEIDRVAVDLDGLASARRRIAAHGSSSRHGSLLRRRASGVRLLVARQRGHRLPRREEIEGAEILRQLDRLIDDLLAVLVVADLDIAGQREILAQRMTLEAVIGQDAAQIGLAGEDDAEQVPGLALPPRRARPDAVQTDGTGVASSVVDDHAHALVQRRPTAGCRRRRSARRAPASRRRRYPSAARTRSADRRAASVISADERVARGVRHQLALLQRRRAVTPGNASRPRRPAPPARRRSRLPRVSHAGWSRCGGSSSAAA